MQTKQAKVRNIIEIKVKDYVEGMWKILREKPDDFVLANNKQIRQRVYKSSIEKLSLKGMERKRFKRNFYL